MTKHVDYTFIRRPPRLTELRFDPSKLKIKSLTLTQMGYYPKRTWQRKGQPFYSWAMLYISDGSGYYRCGDQPEQAVRAGSLFFVWPGETFYYGPKAGEYWEEYFINFEGSRIREWLAEGLIASRIVTFPGPDIPMVSRIEHMFTLLESGIPLNHDRAALMLESLLLECSIQAGSGEPAALRRTERDSRVIDAISEQLFQPFHAVTLAAKLNISLSTLRRVVKDFSGYSLHDFVHRLKIIEAKKLLLHSDISVKELAHALGYEDAHYFSRLFKKYAGVSPAKFRRDLIPA